MYKLQIRLVYLSQQQHYKNRSVQNETDYLIGKLMLFITDIDRIFTKWSANNDRNYSLIYVRRVNSGSMG